MTSREFCYWLQGYFEIAKQSSQPPGLTTYQTSIIEKHLAMVFKHEIDPSYEDAEELNKLHSNNDNVLVRC